MTLAEQSNATVIPAQAITAGQQGAFVYVVRADGTVAPRSVVSSRTVEGQAVIDSGLKAGETVVIDGQVRLVPGATVQIKNNLRDSSALSCPRNVSVNLQFSARQKPIL